MKKWERIIIYGLLGFVIICGILHVKDDQLKWKKQTEINITFARSDSLAFQSYILEMSQRLSSDSLIIELNREMIQKIRNIYGR